MGMFRVGYVITAIIIAAILTAMVVTLIMHGMTHHKLLNQQYTYLTELLEGVPTPSVCIVSYGASPYIGNLTANLGKLGVPYVVMNIITNESVSKCNMLVMSTEWLNQFGSNYKPVIIYALESGIPVEAVGPNAGNTLLNVIGDFISKKAAVIVGVPTGHDKQLKPEVPSSVTALGIVMIPLKNATRLPTGWSIYEGVPASNVTYTVLKTWREYNEALSKVKSPLVLPFPLLTTALPPKILFQTSGYSLQVNIQGFNYVGYIGPYQTQYYDWFGNLAGEQELRVDFYYTTANNYYFFLNLIKHGVIAFNPPDPSTSFIPCYAGEGVNAYSTEYPGRVWFQAAPTGSATSQKTISYSIGTNTASVTVTEYITSGAVGWNYLGLWTEGQDTWRWNFQNPSTETTYELVPGDIWQLDPSKPGGYPPLYETINATAGVANIEWWPGNYLCNYMSPISVTVDVYPTYVHVLQVNT
ncbi:hypothetical protein [Vulcanisaeta distributa]|uniref:Uncharacterized protein n=1 Tax=Vulcanisaeta distributa (strain DSM 14429 / JCM 11212 / NBRC 100878 / IC-017) TaxID=572478 RepID=E1QQ04_VULDI|nr:hypothetical protein [Vulcanisaeta distributa]ADN50376.1 hypothetical protein Vdis_0986 [Vulcanisaeta distributa DSM 14429]